MCGGDFEKAGLLGVGVAGAFERVACGEDLRVGGGGVEEGADAEVGGFWGGEAGAGEGEAEEVEIGGHCESESGGWVDCCELLNVCCLKVKLRHVTMTLRRG